MTQYFPLANGIYGKTKKKGRDCSRPFSYRYLKKGGSLFRDRHSLIAFLDLRLRLGVITTKLTIRGAGKLLFL
jgi:hypothetical protein